LLIAVTVFLMMNVSAFAQEKSTKAEYVVELMNSKTINSVFIVATNYHKEYKKAWLGEISANGDLLILKAGDKIHSWDISDALLIEQYADIIKVKLKDKIGL